MNSKRNRNSMVQNSNSFLIVALQLFLGESVIGAEKHEDETVSFVTMRGDSGFMGPNFTGNWDIWIGDEVVYEVESDLYEIIQHQKDENLIELYEYIKSIDPDGLKYKSKRFLEVVTTATENVILNFTLPLNGQVTIGDQEVIYKNKKKIKINLN